jgi:hypothetical protein
MKQLLATLFLAFLFATTLFAQDSIQNYCSKDFRSLEFKMGLPTLIVKWEINPSVLYQRNLQKHIAAIVYSDISFAPVTEKIKNNYLYQRSFHWVEAVGIGATFGNKGINNGFFILGGGRYFYSKMVSKEALMPELVRNSFTPELSLMYNLKVGKKKLYGTFQIFYPLYPFSIGFNGEGNISASLGVGYRIKQ